MLHGFLLSFTAIFVALDIIGAIPIYLSMTKELSGEARVRVVNTSMGVAFLVATIFVFIGQGLFEHLGITLPDFKIAGGIILLLIALSDLLGGPESQNRASGSTGIVPLAVPLITGPGVLTTLILQVASQGYLITLAALLINYLVAWWALRHCDLIKRVIGRDGTVVLSKIAALLLSAIAVAMVRAGIVETISAHFLKN
jgi:multiple antibiotic resistance protein